MKMRWEFLTCITKLHTPFLRTRFTYLEALMRIIKSLNKTELKKCGILERGAV